MGEGKVMSINPSHVLLSVFVAGAIRQSELEMKRDPRGREGWSRSLQSSQPENLTKRR